MAAYYHGVCISCVLTNRELQELREKLSEFEATSTQIEELAAQLTEKDKALTALKDRKNEQVT